MIDVGKKRKTRRMARAVSFVKLEKGLLEKIKHKNIPKGDVLETARLAGIMAAKKTAELIPFCHNIELEYAGIDFTFAEDGLWIESVIKATAKTGVEMEAMTACAVAGLAVYDMCKMFSRAIEISRVALLEKQGGKSGTYRKSLFNKCK